MKILKIISSYSGARKRPKEMTFPDENEENKSINLGKVSTWGLRN